MLKDRIDNTKWETCFCTRCGSGLALRVCINWGKKSEIDNFMFVDSLPPCVS